MNLLAIIPGKWVEQALHNFGHGWQNQRPFFMYRLSGCKAAYSRCIVFRYEYNEIGDVGLVERLQAAQKAKVVIWY